MLHLGKFLDDVKTLKGKQSFINHSFMTCRPTHIANPHSRVCAQNALQNAISIRQQTSSLPFTSPYACLQTRPTRSRTSSTRRNRPVAKSCNFIPPLSTLPLIPGNRPRLRMLHCIYHRNKPAPKARTRRLAIVRNNQPSISPALRFAPTPNTLGRRLRSPPCVEKTNAEKTLASRATALKSSATPTFFRRLCNTSQRASQSLRRSVVSISFSTERYAFNLLLAVRGTCVQLWPFRPARPPTHARNTRCRLFSLYCFSLSFCYAARLLVDK